MKRIITRLLTILCGLAALAFGADYLLFQYRVLRNDSPYATVTVQEYYEIQEKNNRTEYVYKDTQQDTCINALFSHRGYAPCWYARKHTDRAVRI
jgi:hypothetical protein